MIRHTTRADGPPGNGEAGQSEDHPAHNVETATTPLVTNTAQRNAGRQQWLMPKALWGSGFVACPLCINCTCGMAPVQESLGLEGGVS